MARITLRDGEHEHPYNALVCAEDRAHALALMNAKMHDCGDDEVPPVRERDPEEADYPYGFGDGTTAATLTGLQEITEDDYETIKRVLCILDFSE